jgi:hypothetical protein
VTILFISGRSLIILYSIDVSVIFHLLSFLTSRFRVRVPAVTYVPVQSYSEYICREQSVLMVAYAVRMCDTIYSVALVQFAFLYVRP